MPKFLSISIVSSPLSTDARDKGFLFSTFWSLISILYLDFGAVSGSLMFVLGVSL